MSKIFGPIPRYVIKNCKCINVPLRETNTEKLLIVPV
jgi:hypothetical protein